MAVNRFKVGRTFLRLILAREFGFDWPAACLCLLITSAMVPVLDGAVAAESPTQADKNERLIKYFESIVFDREFQTSALPPAVSKWESGVRVSLKGVGAERHRRKVNRHVDLLSRLTGLDMKVLRRDGGTGNIVIHFVAPTEMETVPIKGVDPQLLWRMAQSRGCYFVSISRESKIVQSDIVVNRARDDQGINHCLLEEITQSLGLPNDSNFFQPSLFSDQDNLVTLPDHDQLLLKILYHSDMRAGFFRLRARNAARRILSQMQYDRDEATVGTDDPLPRDISKIPKKPDEPGMISQ